MVERELNARLVLHEFGGLELPRLGPVAIVLEILHVVHILELVLNELVELHECFEKLLTSAQRLAQSVERGEEIVQGRVQVVGLGQLHFEQLDLLEVRVVFLDLVGEVANFSELQLVHRNVRLVLDRVYVDAALLDPLERLVHQGIDLSVHVAARR